MRDLYRIQRDRVQRLLGYIGIDEAMRPVLFGRAWSLFAGPVSMLLVAQCLTAEEQGFNYTFASLLALQVFLELGFNQSIVQFSAHESAHLHLNVDRTLSGPENHLERLAALFRFFLRWYWGLSAGFLCLVGTIGVWFLGRNPHPDVVWLAPWVLLVIVTSITLAIQPVIYFLTGLNQVAFTNRINATNSVVLSVAFWIALLSGSKLFANPLGALGAFALVSTRLIIPFRALWRQLWSKKVSDSNKVNFRRDILPFQGRITFTFLTGYFVFQLFTPACFHFAGSAEAGRFGMTLALLMTITGVAQAFVYNKAPLFAKYVATGHDSELKATFRGAYTRCVLVAAAGLMLGVPTLMAVKQLPMFADRLLEAKPAIILAVGLLLQCGALASTYYVRAFREEPFLYVAWAQAIITPVAVFYLGKNFGVEGLCWAFFTSWIIGTPWILFISLGYWRRRIKPVPCPLQS